MSGTTHSTSTSVSKTIICSALLERKSETYIRFIVHRDLVSSPSEWTDGVSRRPSI